MNEKKLPDRVPKGYSSGGQFTSSGEVSNLPSARKIADTVPQKAWERQDAPSSRGKNKSQEEFFGEEFTGVKGADAIEKLLQEKRGHVKNAFERPEIGGIDLVWGDENGGLLHTIQKRDKLLAKGIGTISGMDMVKKIPEIIEKGEFDIDDRNRPGFVYGDCRVAVRPTFYGKKLNWIVTAFEILK